MRAALGLLVLLFLLEVPYCGAQFFWTASPALIEERVVQTGNPSARRTSISFRLEGVQFSQEMVTDEFVFPHSCNSSEPQNRFGWERHKSNMLIQTSIQYRRGETTIQFQLEPQNGFTLTFDEVIRCGRGFSNAQGSSYVVGGNTLPADARNFAFTIRAMSFVVLKLLNRNGHVASTGLDGIGSAQTGLAESDVRHRGLVLQATLENDAWNPAFMDTILRSFSCTSLDVAACQWFYSVTNMTEFISIPDRAPNTVLINATRLFTRTFDMDNDMTIRMDVPASSNFTLGFKPPTFEWRLFDSQIQFVIHAETVIPEVIFNSETSVSEACLRGRLEIDPDCERQWVVNMRQTGSNVQFRIASDTFRDLDEITFESAASGIVRPLGNVRYAMQPNGFAPNPHIILMDLRNMYEYDVAVSDVISVRLPYSLFNILEAPKAVIQLQVTPSAGDVVGELFDVDQRELWNGGVVMKITMGGESWPAALNSSAAFLQYSSGNVTAPVLGSWNMESVRSCLLPEGAVSFGADSHGRENRSEIVLRFQPCPEFLLDTTERVTFTFPNDIGVSGIPLHSQWGLSFTITKSPGEFSLRGDAVVEEEDLVNGRVSHTIVLLGEVWDVAGTCFSDMLDAWTTDVPLSTSDPAGWASPASRAALLGEGAGSFSGFNISGRHHLQVNFRANSIYETRKGEVISVSVPPSCIMSRFTIGSSEPTTITVVPQNGNVTVYFGTESSTDLEKASEISESRIRNGNFFLLLVARRDTFEISRGEALKQEIVDGIVTEQTEPLGFLRRKDELISAADVVFVNLTAIKIPMRRDLRYRIRYNETISVGVRGEWMGSGRRPLNGTWDLGNCFDGPCPYNFTIFASAGDIMVEWLGHPNSSEPPRDVTEDDLRDGRLWFTFNLLGDQWRQERSAFRDMFNVDSPQPFGMQSMGPQLVPAIEFFVFKTATDYEICSLRLQSSFAFDIDFDEEVELTLPGRSMNSGIAPVFNVLVRELASFPFIIRVSPGRAVLSGVSTGLDEKMIRSGGVRVFVTLFGEKWRSDATALILDDNSMVLGGTQASALSLESAVVTESSNGRELVLSLRREEGFNIDQTSSMEVLTPGSLMRSGLAPIHSPFIIPILATGGELVYTPLREITEEDLRSGDVELHMRLFGDEWDVQTIVANFEDFVGGMSSLSSSVLEPQGFFANRDSLLQGLTSVDANADITRIILKQTPQYDIDADEILTFTIIDSAALQTRIMPDPNSVRIRIRTQPRFIVCIADDTLPGTQVLGRYNTALLVQRISTMLLVDSSRIEVSINATAYRDDGYAVLLLRFFNRAAGAPATERTSAELSDMMLSIRNDFLFEQLGVRWVYFLDAPPPDEEVRHVPPTPAPPPPNEPPSRKELLAWIFGCLGFVAVMMAVFATKQYVKQGSLAGSARRGHGNDGGGTRYGEQGAPGAAAGPVGAGLGADLRPTDLHRDRIGADVDRSSESGSDGSGKGARASPDSDRVPARMRGATDIGRHSTVAAQRPMGMKEFARRRLGARVGGGDLGIFDADEDFDGPRVADSGFSQSTSCVRAAAEASLQVRGGSGGSGVATLTHRRSDGAASQRAASNTARSLQNMMDLGL